MLTRALLGVVAIMGASLLSGCIMMGEREHGGGPRALPPQVVTPPPPPIDAIRPN